MSSILRPIALVIALLGTVSLAAVQQPPPASLVKANATVKLTDHVWAIPDFNVGGVSCRGCRCPALRGHQLGSG